MLLTPIHRSGFYANEKNWQVPEDYTNRCGEYLDAYVDAVKEAGQVWAVPVIDLGALSGLDPYKEYTPLKSRELEELPRFGVMSWQPS